MKTTEAISISGVDRARQALLQASAAQKLATLAANTEEFLAVPIASPSVSKWPRITMVTPVYNGARYIEETIRSIVHQGYPNLEYIVVDGGSNDGTVDIIRKYEKYISWWVSKRDRGVYDALNTGFAQATGTIMGWLNASDLLHTSGRSVVGSVFAALPEIEWITGRPTRFNPNA